MAKKQACIAQPSVSLARIAYLELWSLFILPMKKKVNQHTRILLISKLRAQQDIQ
jgi:hypothetical protein